MADLVAPKHAGAAKAGATEDSALAVAPPDTEEFLGIGLAGEKYAVPLARVREILTVPPITDVPRSAPHVLGICSVRGLLVTVMDLRLRLRLPAAPVGPLSRVLLTRTSRDEVVGLFVDVVYSVLRLRRDQIELASTAFGSDAADHVTGIGRPGGTEVIVLLDMESVAG